MIRAARRLVGTMMLAGTLLASNDASAGNVTTVGQHDRAFDQADISVAAGDTVRFKNDDAFAHQIFVDQPGLSIDTDEREPGQSVDIVFPTPGNYDVLCHIHPRMLLHVHVH